MLTDLTFLNPGQQWPPESETPRIDRYRDSRLLFDGEHQRVFTDWPRIVRHDENAALEFVLNYPKRLSTLWADLLLGEPPRFTVEGIETPEPEQNENDRWVQPKAPEQEWLDRVVADTGLLMTSYQVGIDMSRFGDGLFKVGLGDDNEATITSQTPAQWYPVLNPDDVKEVQAHVIAWKVTRNESRLTGAVDQSYLRVQVHEIGRVENRLYQVDGTGTVGRQLPLAVWDEELAEEWNTGIDDFLIVHAANLQTTETVFGRDDYSDLFSILQEMAMRLGQVSRILDKHADPSMYGPSNAVQIDAQGEPVFYGGGRWFPVDEGDTPPGYITWDGQLQAAYDELETLQQQLYILSETSPAAFGQMQQVVAESGTALRRLMMVPLAKVNRVRLFFDPAMRRVLEVCAKLERAQGNRETPEIPGIEIEWHDGLPEDPKEAAEIERMRREAGTTSVYSAISRQDGGSEAAILQELDRIREEQAADAGAEVAGMPPLNLQFDGGEDET